MTATVETPPPRLVAAAIADLAAPQVREAWRYLDAFEALASAGVPRSTIRECLDDPQDTEPLRELVAWTEATGERGLLCLVGDPGTGKTYAEARWVLDRHRRGLFTHWLAAAALPMMSLRDREVKLAAVADVRALVIDDVGTGAGQGDFLRDQLRGLLQHRIDSLRPTVLASNAKLKEMDAWLGARLVDRCKIAGGTIEVRSSESLRSESHDKLDALGRGPEWYAARRIVDLIGCELRERYDAETGKRLADELAVGNALDRDARRHGYEACKRARLALGLEAAAVSARARELAEAEAQLCEWAAGTLGVKTAAMSLSFEGVAAMAAEKLREMRETQRKEDEETVAQILERARRRLDSARGHDSYAGPSKDATPPAWAMSNAGRRKLHALGFRVRSEGATFRVSRAMSEKHEVRLAFGCKDEAEAWLVAALLCADSLEDQALHESETGLRNAS